jgi:uncharacterized protein
MTVSQPPPALNDADLDAFSQSWQEWHRKHEERRADPHGFLAITNLHWLDGRPKRFPDAPGAWQTTTDGVTVEVDDGEELIVDGARVRGRHSFGVVPERASLFPTSGDAVIEVAKRGGHDIIRPRHPQNPLRTTYVGTEAFAAHPRWVAEGRFVAFEQPRPIAVGAAVDGLEHIYDAPGTVEFSLDGHPLTLTAFPGHGPGSLFVLFTDATSGVTTYAANRSLPVSPPDADGRVTLDFNRATNLPCAYTDLATCPLPPAENRLTVAIEAGEKTPFGPA